MPSFSRSEALLDRARRCLPGGVSSPVRSFSSVTGTPRFLRRGAGARVEDEDGAWRVDWCLAWGAMILGHAHPAVVEGVQRAAADGLGFGACHRFEADLAERLLDALPHAQRVRFTCSGTEAVMTAVRIARAGTGRALLLKFAGCYHGHSDGVMSRAGSGIATLGLAGSDGVTAAVAAETIVVRLDDLEAVAEAFRQHGETIAAVIVEPVPANEGLLPHRPGFLRSVADLARAHGSLVIFDEVITGFRSGWGGSERLAGVTPDLTTLGKIIGGGLPVGAVAGPASLLDRLAPLGGTYHAGTCAGNPVALAAGIATLDALRDGAAHAHVLALATRLRALAAHRGIPLAQEGSMFWPHLDALADLPYRPEDISPSAVRAFGAAHSAWLDAGHYLPPSAHEVGFLCAAHRMEDVDDLADCLGAALAGAGVPAADAAGAEASPSIHMRSAPTPEQA